LRAHASQWKPIHELNLKAEQLKDRPIREEIWGQFAKHGISPERLAFQPYTPRTDYLCLPWLICAKAYAAGFSLFPCPMLPALHNMHWMACGSYG